MEQQTADSIKTALTKSCIAILIELYKSPPLQHKSLAANMHISPTSLCNILHRIKKIVPPLIEVQEVGRSKYYFLTDIAKQYVEEQLLFNNSNIQTSNTLSEKNSGTNEALQALACFQVTVGSAWHIVLDDFLSGKYTKTNEFYPLYREFVNKMKELTVHTDLDSLQEVYTVLHQNILITRLKECVTTELANYYALKPLFNLEKQNLESAILLIDYIFTKIKPDIFIDDNFPLSLQHLPLTKDAYQKILYQLTNMVNEFFDYYGKKSVALENWQHVFLSNNFSLYYIAEKCHTIYWHNR